MVIEIWPPLENIWKLIFQNQNVQYTYPSHETNKIALAIRFPNAFLNFLTKKLYKFEQWFDHRHGIASLTKISLCLLLNHSYLKASTFYGPDYIKQQNTLLETEDLLLEVQRRVPIRNCNISSSYKLPCFLYHVIFLVPLRQLNVAHRRFSVEKRNYALRTNNARLYYETNPFWDTKFFEIAIDGVRCIPTLIALDHSTLDWNAYRACYMLFRIVDTVSPSLPVGNIPRLLKESLIFHLF